MVKISDMTDQEIVEALQGTDLLCKVRKIFYSECGRIEQLESQRRSMSPVDRRRLEFEVARKILDEIYDVLAPEINSAGRALADGIDAAYEYSCTCGEGERGEMNCRHCNASIKATDNFDKTINEIFEVM